jgi:TIR domain
MGDRLRDKVYEAIQRQDKLLIVLSEHAIGSAWVEEEVDAALDREHQQKGTYLLFPIRLDDQVIQTSKAWAITVRQRYIGDFRQWTDNSMYQRALQRLLRDLHT